MSRIASYNERFNFYTKQERGLIYSSFPMKLFFYPNIIKLPNTVHFKLKLPVEITCLHCWELKFANLFIRGFDLADSGETGKRYTKAKRFRCTLPVS